jgi:hypothetical protein
MSDDNPEIVWYLAFEDCNTLWWHRFLKPGYRHCWAFKAQVIMEDPPRAEWLLFDPMLTGLDVRLVPKESAVGWLALGINGDLRILRVPEQRVLLARPRFFVSCAGALAALVGYSKTPLTPWGLYRRLRRLPGVEVVA